MESRLSRGAMERYNMICAGFGFRSQAPFESFLEVLERLKKEHLISGPIGAIATIAHKAMAPDFRNLSAQKGLAIIAVHPDDITRQKTQSFSQNAMDLYGTGSIAEAAALAASGSNACLLGPRIICAHRMVTCAFAKGDQI